MGKQIINLLWTGGWDSTFRLLDLLLVKAKLVQPYYVIDSDRRSTGLELRTMKDIKQRLFAEYPETKNLLLPTRYKELYDIQPNVDITQSFERIRSKHFIGSQYDWLARFAHETRIKDMEMSIEWGEKWEEILGQFLSQSVNKEILFQEISKEFEGSDEHTLWKYFRFPIFNLRKADTQTISKNEGFFDLMKLTWFCHRPCVNGTPCGVCNPCTSAMRQGMRWRLPFVSRVRYHLWLLPRARRVLQKYPRLHRFASNIKHKVWIGWRMNTKGIRRVPCAK
ncbi:MAG: hypothetical protein ACYSSI_05880 [Planctomycetota bacterium]|jgi:hypothetical protein